MKQRTNIILIVIITALIILSLPGGARRIENEEKSHVIGLVADYTAFKVVTDKVKIDIFKQFEILSQYGMNTVLVSNKTIRDYETEGRVSIYNVYEIVNLARNKGIDAGHDGYFQNSLFIIPDDGWYEHIKKKLDNRFAPDSVIETEYEGSRALILNAELDERVGVNMGFDEDVINSALERGYRVALSMQNENFGSTKFIEEIQYLFDIYDISYVEINSFAYPGYPDAELSVIDIIKDAGVPLMLKGDFGTVNPRQTAGLYEHLYATDFYAARTFYIKDYIPFSNVVTPVDYYYRMLRAAVDRGNRFFVISPITHTRRIFSQALTDTETMLRLFYNRLNGEFDFHDDVPGARFDTVPSVYSYFSALAIIFAALLILINAFDKKRIYYILYILFVIGYLVAAFLFIRYLGRLNALMGTLVYPSLFGVYLGGVISKDDKKPKEFIFGVIPAFFALAAAGAITAVVNLSDARNFLGITQFTGVKLSFVVPVIVFFIVFVLSSADKGEIFKKTVLISRMPVTYLALVLLGIGAFAAYVYLIRSGNESGGLVVSYELRIREFFENLVLARPRTKEFVFGYPALALLAYFSAKNIPGYIRLILGAAAMTGHISLVNTFCHVTAYVGISVLRSIYGILLGIMLFAILLLIIYCGEKYYNKLRMERSDA